jgi:hypothetical protein
MQIETSLDWNPVFRKMADNLHHLPYNPDLYKMLNNIDDMVQELSRQEVDARRIRKPEYTKEKVDSINNAIDHFEKLLLIAHLMA